MKHLRQPAVIAMLLAAVICGPAAAQAPEQHITINFTPAVVTVGGDAETALSGSGGIPLYGAPVL